MVKKRLIFTLLYDQGKYCLSRNFRLQRVGNLQWLFKNYNLEHVTENIDELVILNVSRSQLSIDDAFCEDVARIVERSFLPVAVGGGIRSLADAEKLFKIGADKIVLNSPLFENQQLVRDLSEKYGAQALIASIDCIKSGDEFYPVIDQGKKRLETPINEYLKTVAGLGVGEFYITSIDKDGTGQGFNFELLNHIEKKSLELKIPLIASGGAGKYQHFDEALGKQFVDAASTANILNFIGDSLPQVRKKLIELGVHLARW